MSIPTELFHFTCIHSKKDIGTSNCLLIPHPHVLLGARLLWLTSEAQPERDGVGLTSETLVSCDRMQFRYVVDDLAATRPWMTSLERAAGASGVVRALESYAQPETWWIANRPVRARFDRSWRHIPTPSQR